MEERRLGKTEKEIIKEALGFDYYIDPDLEELSSHQVVYVKYGKYSKQYAYLLNGEVEAGMKVWVPGRDEPLEVIRVEVLAEKDLPVPLEQMKEAMLIRPIEESLQELLDNNKVLRKVEKRVELIGRKEVIEDLLVAINKKRMRNSVLIGEAGCGKTTIVESFSDIVKDNYIVLSFNVGELISGTIYRGMLEEKLTKIFNDVLEFNMKYQKKVILFIDEFHMIVSNAGCEGGVSMHDVLKPYLTNNNLIVIGATTIKEYNTYIKRDVALMRRITPVYVDMLSDSSIIQILDNFSNHTVDKELLSNILTKTKEIPNTTNPDISLEVLDRVLAMHSVLGYEINLTIINREINKLKESYEII